jgi:hypothetical protein
VLGIQRRTIRHGAPDESGGPVNIQLPTHTSPMKSAFELAMERLEKQSPTQKLTAAQKKEIGEIESTCRAKIAEREVFLRDQIAKAQAADKFEEIAELEQQLVREIRRINNDAEEKKEKIRGKS